MELHPCLDGVVPGTVIVFGISYNIRYFSERSEVDCDKFKSYSAQVNYSTREIRVYYPDNVDERETWQSIIHEIVHLVIRGMAVKDLENEDHIDAFAVALVDTLTRNGWLSFGFGSLGQCFTGPACDSSSA